MTTTLFEILEQPFLTEGNSDAFSLKESELFWGKIYKRQERKKKFFNKPTLLKFCKEYGLLQLYKVCHIDSLSEQSILKSFIDSDREYSTLPQMLRNKLFLMIKAKG